MPSWQVLRTVQIFLSLHICMEKHRVVASLGAMVASTDVRADKDDVDLSPEDGSAVR